MRYESRARARKGAVSLIEILVALAIITILVSLSAAAIHRVRLNGMIRTTETTVGRLQMGVDKQVTIISDEVRTKDVQQRSADFAALLPYCGGDADRAAALLLYCRLKQNFPTVAELPAAGYFGFQLFGVNFPYSPTFRAAVGAGGTAEAQSGAILYIALAQRSQGGNSFSADEGTAKQLSLPGNLRAFGDAWENPVGFQRFAQPVGLAGNPNLDPFDPKGRLAAWNVADPNRTTAQTVLGVTFNGQNKTILVYSTGPDARPAASADNIEGHRLRSVGDRGTKP